MAGKTTNITILTHPCAGKTYLAERIHGFLDNPSSIEIKHSMATNKRYFIAVSRFHKIKKYDVAMVLNDNDFSRNIKCRIKNPPKRKIFIKEEKIRREREETRKLAKKLELPIYDTFEDIIKKHSIKDAFSGYNNI